MIDDCGSLVMSDRSDMRRFLLAGLIIIVAMQLQLSYANSSTVQLKMNLKDPWLELACEVKNNRRTIYLYCPHVAGKEVVRPCFQECTPLCSSKDCPGISDIGCKKNEIGSVRTMTYTVNSKKLVNKGEWWCQVGNQKSLIFDLSPPPPKSTPKPTTTTKRTTPTTKPPKKKDSGHIGVKTGVTVVKPEPKHPVLTIDKEDYKYQENGRKFWSELTSPHLVIVVLGLLGTSLVVNVAFCIRCILVKKYIDKYRRGVSDTSCLERCLCLPKARVRAGYKEDLYEDLSSTPRAVYSPGGSAKSSGVDREDSLEFQSLARSRAYSPSTHRSQNPAARVGDIYATVVRGPRRSSAGPRYYSPQPPPVSQQRVYDDVPDSRSLSDIYARPQRLRPSSAMAGGGASSSSATGSSGSPRHSPDSSGTPSTIALKRVSEHPVEEEAEESDREEEGEMIEECTRNNTRLELSKTLLHRADTLLREAGVLLD